ncbi:hypothetical protein PMZ80_010080 [Knufia obscura]|uniref:Uncharacterized protein n=2 Tax=Knufia TaxID=430999 RepID=A0AAN8I775_9EURO|nr:hypothetical protein PMZ80_010080 [Knufia obscura]KAK5952821.1 hypothetical protein OHC33_005940 [Knufia fluminis]
MVIQTGIPLWKYHHVLDIARKLIITPLINDLQSRLNKMLQSPWAIQADDITKVYQTLGKDHPLRQAITNGLAPAWPKLYGKNKDKMYKLAWDKEIPEFWADLEARWAEMVEEGEEDSNKK